MSPPDPAAEVIAHVLAGLEPAYEEADEVLGALSDAGLTPLPDGHTRIDGHSYTLERYVVYAGEWVYRLRPFDATDPNIVPSQADGETR